MNIMKNPVNPSHPSYLVHPVKSFSRETDFYRMNKIGKMGMNKSELIG
jgi:hypothetical protein